MCEELINLAIRIQKGAKQTMVGDIAEAILLGKGASLSYRKGEVKRIFRVVKRNLRTIQFSIITEFK